MRLHLTSDVPVGAFLSGGLDSTLVASYAARMLGSELRTFSMGIPYRDLNELPAAAAVAARYGTRHFAQEVSPPSWPTCRGSSRRSTSPPILCPSVCFTWPR